LKSPIEQLEQWFARTASAETAYLQNQLGLSAYDARVLTDDRTVGEYFEARSLTPTPNKLPTDHG